MSLPRPVLIVGFSPALPREFSRGLPQNGVVIVEEPAVAAKRDARRIVAEMPVCRMLIEEEVLLPGGADRFYLRHADLDPIAVVPAHDYAVPAAARIAERFGLPGAGLGAAEILRDKHLLRVVAESAGIANPISRPVSSAEEVDALWADTGGPIIIKPANRQAAIGTLVVRERDEIPLAWQQCLAHEEEACRPDREQELRMLAEQLVIGAEYSVEMLYRDGKQYFANVTAKVLYGGPRPVELGHLVPAPIGAELTEALIAETERLLDAVDFGAGLAHCEWIVQDGVPYLVECAGRQPGDFILELIKGAYEYDVFGAYLDLMRGGEPARSFDAKGGAATWHGVADPGEVVSISGVDEAAEMDGVRRCDVSTKVGAEVGQLRSSWDRLAVVTAFAETASEASAIAQRAIDRIQIVTR